jgi:MarR family transcriptional regulator, organic hydroperoxide resistance regulator
MQPLISHGALMPKSAFGFEQPQDSPGFLLWQTTVTWQRLIKQSLDKHDISHAQFVVLANLLWFEEHQQTPKQIMIVQLSKLDKMTVSKSFKKLVSDKLVTRTESKTDTRAKSVKLTAKGKKLTAKLINCVEAIDEQFFGVLSKKERQQLLGLFNKLVV